MISRSLATAALAAVLTLAATVPASGLAGPRYILVHGGGLPEALLLDDAAGNELLVSSPDILPLAGVPRVEDRPVYELAIFFIVPDLAGRNPASLRPDETQAVGRFYPAVGTYEAVFELGAVPGIGPRRDGGLTPPMLDYLVSKGVPVVSALELGPEQPSPEAAPVETVPSVQQDRPSGGPAWLLPFAISAGLLALLGTGAALRRRFRKSRRGQLHW
ncbi:MAG: hypothetical protein R3B97_12465 [Dehalococcoidia bacterium]|nr:hypothetical protein [Dehalococcoidia bacterium]MCA9832185.1 hypothetical protein [Dehalococcoidia bacterium]